MTPSLIIPNDNIYKFACLFGLALIIVSIFAFVSVYTSSLDKIVKYSETITYLEAKAEPSKIDLDVVKMNRDLIALTNKNKDAGILASALPAGLGIFLSFYGAIKWYNVIQPRDDKIVSLQIAKLEAEIAKLKSETIPVVLPPSPPASS